MLKLKENDQILKLNDTNSTDTKHEVAIDISLLDLNGLSNAEIKKFEQILKVSEDTTDNDEKVVKDDPAKVSKDSTDNDEKDVKDDPAKDQNQLSAAGGKLMDVEFHVTWCGPCKIIAPHLEEMSKTMEEVVFLKIDVDECDNAGEYILAMPDKGGGG